MRKIRLLISLSLVLFCVHQISAQRHSYGHRKQKPTVYMVAFEQVDTVNCPIQQTIAQNNLAAQSVRADFAETHRRGFQQLHNPQFVFTTKNNRFSLGIGGEINLRASYDLKGAVDNIDFVPYDIPMDATFANRQRIMMDATASRLFTKAVVNSDVLGRVVAYVDMDFRGGEEFSYIPHLRSAYVSMLGFTAGRDVTTFCDLEAVPETIDHEVTNHKNSGHQWLLQIIGKFFHFLDVLRFLYNDYLIFRHHGITLGRIDDSCNIRIRPVQDSLVKLLFFLRKHRLSNIFRYTVNVIRLLSHQIIHRLIDSVFQVTGNLFVCCFLSHFTIRISNVSPFSFLQ